MRILNVLWPLVHENRLRLRVANQRQSIVIYKPMAKCRQVDLPYRKFASVNSVVARIALNFLGFDEAPPLVLDKWVEGKLVHPPGHTETLWAKSCLETQCTSSSRIKNIIRCKQVKQLYILAKDSVECGMAKRSWIESSRRAKQCPLPGMHEVHGGVLLEVRIALYRNIVTAEGVMNDDLGVVAFLGNIHLGSC